MRLILVVTDEVALDLLHEVVQRAAGHTLDLHVASGVEERRVACSMLEARRDQFDEVADLPAVALRVREQEAEVATRAELVQRPVEPGDAREAAGGLWQRLVTRPTGRKERHRFERSGRQAKGGPPSSLLLRQPSVRPVEEQEVLALHVEDQRLRRRPAGAERLAFEQPVQQERRVRRFRGHPGDTGDVHVRTARSVQELQVPEDRALRPVEADGEPQVLVAVPHPVEVERGVPLLVGREVHGLARHRRDVDLGCDTRDGDVRRDARLRRQDAVRRECHVRGERDALLHRLQRIDDAVGLDHLAVRQRCLHVDDVVELQVGVRRDPCGEGEGRGGVVPHAQHERAEVRVRVLRSVHAAAPSEASRAIEVASRR